MKGKTVLVVLYTILFCALWTVYELYLSPFLDKSISNAVLCRLIKDGFIKSLFWTIPALLLMGYRKKDEKMEIQHLTNQYIVRDLIPADRKMIYEALQNHTIFYKYHPPMVTIESILEDMAALPPNKGYEDKHYIGFFSGETLIAVMDLIEHYPQYGTALIGFFALHSAMQGNGIGSAIISDSLRYLGKQGFRKVRLGVDKGNPQSKAFWAKNGFAFTGEEVLNDFSSVFVMERIL
jgi:RimJ/RimL family protein N-acetyltransferase